MATTGEIIKQQRERYSLTQMELAKKLNLSQKAISFYELGHRMPPGDILLKMAKLFNVSTDYLLGNDTEDAAQDNASAQLHDLLEELFTDSPEILNTIKSINAEGKLQSTQGELKLSDTHKAFIKQSILLALKEAKAEQASVKTITIDLDENDKP